MIKFSFELKTFYDSGLEYPDLPSDVVEITNTKHVELLSALNNGCLVFPDLTHSTPRPTQFHEWVGTEWLDLRTDEEIAEHNRAQMPRLNKRDFRKKLRDAKIFEQAESYVRSSGDGYLEDAWDYSDYFSRLDPFILQAVEALDLTPEQLDEIWTQP